MKKIFLFVLLIPMVAYATETCPTPNQLHIGQLNGWVALNLDSALPLDVEAIATFEKKVKAFALAESMANAPEGPAHCYYNGSKDDGSYLGVYLAKNNLIPASTAWHELNSDVSQCDESVKLCLFTQSKI